MRLLLVVVLGGCSILPTVRNPDYCRSNDDCDPGSICNLETHGCEAPPDADPDATTARCDPNKPFEAPMVLPGINTGDHEMSFALAHDELTAYIVRDELTRYRQVMAVRSSIADEFPTATEDPMLAAIGGYVTEMAPSRSGLLLFVLDRNRPHVAQRKSVSEPFLAADQVFIEGADVLQARNVRATRDALTLYWIDHSDKMLRVAPTKGPHGLFGPTRQVSTMPVAFPVVSADELTLYYQPFDVDDIYISKRLSKEVAFEPGTLEPALSAITFAAPMDITRDQCVLYLLGSGSASSDMFVAQRPR